MPIDANVPAADDVRYTLESLREVYAREMFFTTVGTAQKKADEITKWMKDNAPWQDRLALWMPSKRGGYWYKPAANARKFLNARVDYQFGGQEAKERFQRQTTKANKADYNRLKNINAAREEYNNSKRRLEEGGRKKPPLKRLPVSRREFRPDPVAIHREMGGGGAVDITISHGDARQVPYAIWLELAHGGRYNIIRKTMDHWHPKIMRGIQMALNSKREFLGPGYRLPYYERADYLRDMEIRTFDLEERGSGGRRQRGNYSRGGQNSPMSAPGGLGRHTRLSSSGVVMRPLKYRKKPKGRRR